MSTSGPGQRDLPTSQRPTLEMSDDDSIEFETLPPEDSAASSKRPTLPGHLIPSWSALTQDARLPLEIELRLIVDLLGALVPLHTNLRLPPSERAYGKVCRENIVVEPDGTVRLRPRSEASKPPGELAAPELALGGQIDQQADLYAVGTLLLQVLKRRKDGYEGDALFGRALAIATRAVRPQPAERWASAAVFATELVGAAGSRLPPSQALVGYARDQSHGAITGEASATAAITPLPSREARRPPPPNVGGEIEDDRPVLLPELSSTASSLTPNAASSFMPNAAASRGKARPGSKALWLVPLLLLLGVGGTVWWLAEPGPREELVGEAFPAVEARGGSNVQERVPSAPLPEAALPGASPVSASSSATLAAPQPVPASQGKPTSTARPRKTEPSKAGKTTYDPEGI